MIHAKALLVDGMWSVVGSTNFDHRSFGINDEVNLVVSDPALAARLEEDFADGPGPQQGRHLLGLVPALLLSAERECAGRDEPSGVR